LPKLDECRPELFQHLTNPFPLAQLLLVRGTEGPQDLRREIQTLKQVRKSIPRQDSYDLFRPRKIGNQFKGLNRHKVYSK